MAYVTIDGEKYEKELIDLANDFTAGDSGGRFSKEEVEKLFESAMDGRGITETEKKTLNYIRANYKFTDASGKLFDDKMAAV